MKKVLHHRCLGNSMCVSANRSWRHTPRFTSARRTETYSEVGLRVVCYSLRNLEAALYDLQADGFLERRPADEAPDQLKAVEQMLRGLRFTHAWGVDER